MTWLPRINAEPEEDKEQRDYAAGPNQVIAAAREHTKFTHADGGYGEGLPHSPCMSTEAIKGFSRPMATAGGQAEEASAHQLAAERMVALLDQKFGANTAGADAAPTPAAGAADLSIRADVDETLEDIVQLMHARHSLEVLKEILVRRNTGRAGVGSMMDEVGQQRVVISADTTTSLTGAVTSSSIRAGPLPMEEGRVKAMWAATRRRFWGAWHALIPFLPYADPVLPPAEQNAPTAAMLLEFLDATLSTAGDRRIEQVCAVLDSDEDGYLTYNESMQVPELLLLPAQRAAFELYKLHLDLELPKLVAGGEEMPPATGVASIPMRVAYRRRERIQRRDLLRAMRKNLQMLRFHYEVTSRMRCLYHFSDKHGVHDCTALTALTALTSSRMPHLSHFHTSLLCLLSYAFSPMPSLTPLLCLLSLIS
jgi:hypothetical protein